MTVTLHQVPLADSLLKSMSRDLLAGSPAMDPGNCLVLLPSSRACRTLEHVLLDQAPGSALLLPRILTMTQWLQATALQVGMPLDDLPDDRIRPLALAPLLAEQPWLEDHPESAPGLAVDFIHMFDEARMEGCQKILLDGRDDQESLLAGCGAAETEAVLQDVRKVREAWRLYRSVLARDRTDVLVDLAALCGAEDAPRLPGVARVLAGGFGRLTRLHSRLLRAAFQTGQEAVLYLPCAGEDLDRAFCATWSAGSQSPGTDPFSPTRRLRKQLEAVMRLEPASTPDCRETGLASGSTLRQRLDAVTTDRSSLNPGGRMTLLPCPDPETESRLVVDLVVRHLHGSVGPVEPLAVATPDPLLAARILAMLQEAGIDADNSLGSPLGTLPAGLLVRHILRAVLTDLRAESLLEVLTHPFVSLPVKQGSHEQWTLRLEQMFRHAEGPQTGLAGLGRRAAERDEVVRSKFGRHDPGMAAFVNLVAEAFDPLLEKRGAGRAPWREYVAALQVCWRALTGSRPLIGPQTRQDELALMRVWDMLEANAGCLKPVTLADFTTALGRLLSAEMVVPHRQRNLPVMVTGLIEARLEKYEHLILAGLKDSVFPAPVHRQPLLTPRVLGHLGLPGWQEHAGLDAELFLRLLHNAAQVTLTWPREEAGQPILPSPLVSRLALALGMDIDGDLQGLQKGIPLWRRQEPDSRGIVAAQLRADEESQPTTALVDARPQLLLSWSALRMWQECPYRFLLERRFALTREDDLRREFSRLDYGSLVHGALQAFLEPGGPGLAALENGDEAGALAALDQAALDRFSPGAEELPVRRLWLDSFRRAMPSVVQVERERMRTWRPHLLEQRFVLPLPDLAKWAENLCLGIAADPALQPRGGWAAAREQGAAILLRGTVDRLDVHRVQAGVIAVLDYKTGKPPTPSRVKDLEELQVVLYAAAAEAGALDGGLQNVMVAEGAYYQIGEERSGPPPKPHLDGTTSAGRMLLALGTVRLIDLALAAADPQAEYPLLPRVAEQEVKAPLPCRNCDLRGVCRLEEMDRDTDRLPPDLWLDLDRIIHQREGSF